MALEKQIELDNGVIVNYHRVVSINKITNNQNVIEIASYTSKAKRQEEKDYYINEDDNKSMNVFINTNYISKEYNEKETISDVSNYLKTLDNFKNAIDI